MKILVIIIGAILAVFVITPSKSKITASNLGWKVIVLNLYFVITIKVSKFIEAFKSLVKKPV